MGRHWQLLQKEVYIQIVFGRVPLRYRQGNQLGAIGEVRGEILNVRSSGLPEAVATRILEMEKWEQGRLGSF